MRALVCVVVNSGPAFRTERVCKYLAAFGYSYETLQLALRQMEMLGWKSHCHPKRASRLGLTDCAMASVDDCCFARNPVSYGSTLAAAFEWWMHAILLEHQVSPTL